MRRYSEHLYAATTITVKASLNPGVETGNVVTNTEKDDEVAYKRNIESLLQELKKPRPKMN